MAAGRVMSAVIPALKYPIARAGKECLGGLMRGHEHDAPGTHTPNPSSACPVHFPFQRWGAPLGASQCFKTAPASGPCARGTTPDVPRPTGFTTADAQDDFLRARRHAALARL